MVNNPIIIAIVLLLASALCTKIRKLSRVCFWMGLVVLFLSGNSLVVGTLARPLERRFFPPDPIPKADCIVVLAGGTLNQLPPRTTVEVTQEGDRILYAAHLFLGGRAPLVICTGGAAAYGTSPDANDMAELLQMFNIPSSAIVLETRARNTHEHAVNLHQILQERHCGHVLLVTSAMHMPRSLGAFRRACPGVDFIPAPTDFRAVERTLPWYKQVSMCIPGPHALIDCADVMHEYFGIFYYKLRGWM